MKKKELFLLIPLLVAGLTGCVKYNGQGKPGANKSKAEIPSSQKEEESSEWPIQPSIPPSPHGAGEQEPEVPPATNVTVYLVFGENGLYEDQPVTASNTDLFLEHVVEYTALSGTDLPGKDKVTSSVEGSTFVAWTAYNNDGKITEYTKVPSVDKKILYASFTGGKGGEHQGESGGSGGQSSDTPQPNPGFPTEGYGLVFTDGTFMKATYTDKFGDFDQYLIENGSFKQGQSFYLYNFGLNEYWIVPIDSYSFNQQPDQYLGYDEAGKKYHVLKDFTADVYIKLKMNEDQVYFGLKG